MLSLYVCGIFRALSISYYNLLSIFYIKGDMTVFKINFFLECIFLPYTTFAKLIFKNYILNPVLFTSLFTW